MTVYLGIVMDRNIEERRQSITTEKRCDNQLRTKANNVRCGGGERNKAAGHPSEGEGDGNGNGNNNRRQALGCWWHCIRWQRKLDFAVENNSVMGECNFSD